MSEQPNQKALLRRGEIVFAGLAVLTLLEYWFAVGGLPVTVALVLLSLAALLKAGVIVDNYMHARKALRMQSGEEAH